MSDTPSITLTPAAILKWGDADKAPWQQRLFRLGAERRVAAEPVSDFWQQVAAACIATLSHVANPDTSGEADAARVPDIPLPLDASAWLAAAPPMPGGEYLSLSVLHSLWQKLLLWCAEEARREGGLVPFLQKLAPHWGDVGRVFFHLAENKLDADRPFAFMATYAVGLNAQGHPRHVPLSHALQQYAGNGDHPALLRLLEPVARAAECIDWVQAMSSSGRIYHPAPWTPEKAYLFLRSAPRLEASGIGVRLPDWWKQRPRPIVKATAHVRTTSAVGAQALLDFDIQVALGDTPLGEEELTALLQQACNGLVLVKGQWVEVDSHKLEQALAHWQHVERQAKAGGLNFFQGMRLLAGLPPDMQEAKEDDSLRAWSLVEAGEGFQTLLAATRADGLHPAQDIAGLQATLRPYQRHGVAWLQFLGGLGLGACLADDMGLGKTMQVLALLLHEKHARSQEQATQGERAERAESTAQNGDAPTLLIVPASLLGNWHKEAQRYAPSLRLALLHPSEMDKDAMQALEQPQELARHDVVVTTYAMCTRLAWLANIPWRRVIVDEAQAIKNAGTRQSKAVRALRGASRIALTGTPIENGLHDLWALFDFLNPGLLGSAKSFASLTKKLAQAEERFTPLRKLTAPYILRRMKTDKTIIDDLPDKTETALYCHLTKKQMQIYAKVAENLKKTLLALDRSPEAQNRRRMIVLQSLMLLKQICNHPDQAGAQNAEGKAHYASELSGKFQCVADLCADIAARQHRLLVFTQFREITDPLARHLAAVFGSEGLVLHGNISVKHRKELVDAFQQPDGPPFFVLSLRAGGTGLTLTEASHVIHFDRWWNPAVEDQATDRAFRIGQKRNVLVHKCITRGTLEEKIDALITEKRQLADEVLGKGAEVDITALNDDEILHLVQLDAQRAAE